MEHCPCGSDKAYNDCCGPLIEGTHPPETAEALMRSRYTAYATKQMTYIHDTTHPDKRKAFVQEEGTDWAKNYEWQGLEIIKTQGGGPDDEEGMVEFIARYTEKGKAFQHHEVAQFAKEDGTWYFKDGQAPTIEQYVRKGPKVGRNDPCPCGSGKKHKKCCLK